MKKTRLIKEKKDESKNFKLAYEFYCFCRTHPELRFWQALRAWLGKNIWIDGADPFYWEGKDK